MFVKDFQNTQRENFWLIENLDGCFLIHVKELIFLFRDKGSCHIIMPETISRSTYSYDERGWTIATKQGLHEKLLSLSLSLSLHSLFLSPYFYQTHLHRHANTLTHVFHQKHTLVHSQTHWYYTRTFSTNTQTRAHIFLQLSF